MEYVLVYVIGFTVGWIVSHLVSHQRLDKKLGKVVRLENELMSNNEDLANHIDAARRVHFNQKQGS